jgi:xylulokinase
MKKFFLGIDIGSSSVKASLADADDGSCCASAFSPQNEMPIESPYPGWAEQHPHLWEEHAKLAIAIAMKRSGAGPADILAVGISYQMHGLVCIGSDGKVLRPSIIWCDSRAVDIGNNAFSALGRDFCLDRYLNSPGNFTASKLAWVKQNEPRIYDKMSYFMLPGDWLAYRLTGEVCTTRSGLSEGILWDFAARTPSFDLLRHFEIDSVHLPPLAPTFGIQGKVSPEAAKEFGLPAGIPVSYRAGDQPNNAFSLRALEPGDIAATAGTSGVVYSVTDKAAKDNESRVNTFVHVNDTDDAPRNGVLLCINGTGISNSWIRKITGNPAYTDMNGMASGICPGADNLRFIPFGNGAERMLGNRSPGASFSGLDFNRHQQAHLYRAVQEGIAFAFRYGIEVMHSMGIVPSVLHAGKANLFLSPLFCQLMADLTGVNVELYNTDGSLGAALGAGLGSGHWKSASEALEGLKQLSQVEPSSGDNILEEHYQNWKKDLESKL